RKRHAGLLTDALTLPDFTRQVLHQLRNPKPLMGNGFEIQFLPSSAFAGVQDQPDEEIELVAAEQSNTSVLIGERMMLKLVRRVMPGIHPETEMGGFLTERGFTNIAPLLGEVRRVDEQGTPHTLMVLQGYLSNQGDAWQWTQNNLERAIRDELTGGLSEQENQYTALGELQSFATLLGRRLGE